MEGRLRELTRDEVEGVPGPGFAAVAIVRSEAVPDEYYMTVISESKVAYVAHANTPKAHARYQQIAALRGRAPEWHDGEVGYLCPGQQALWGTKPD
jgi:hypothetical protein